MCDAQALQAPEGGAAVITYPVLGFFAGPRADSGRIADIPFGARVTLVPPGRGRRPAPVFSGGMRKVRWNGREGWAAYDSLLPGALLSLDGVQQKDLEAWGPCCQKFLRGASVSFRRINPGDLRPSRVPYQLKSLVLTRSEGETPCAEFVGSREHLRIRGGAVTYSHCLGESSPVPCGTGDVDGKNKAPECGNLVTQEGTCEYRGTHLVIKLRPGYRKERFCRDGKPVSEDSQVRASSFRLHWIARFGCFMTDDELASFNYTTTVFSARDRAFMGIIDRKSVV